MKIKILAAAIVAVACAAVASAQTSPLKVNQIGYLTDDYSDYSTNEPTMDGTASLTFMLGTLSAAGAR